MPEFKYRAVNSRGETVSGVTAGESSGAVIQMIREEGLYPVRIHKTGRFRPELSLQSLKFKREINKQVLSQFCRQLSVIIMSGVNLLNGLEVLSRQVPDKLMREEVSRIYREVQKGRTISEAMQDPDSRVPGLLSGMVATGEASGMLEEVLRNMSDFYEREHRIEQKIKTASIYPLIMALMGLGLIVFFFYFLLPQLVTLITTTGGELPLLTRIVVAISSFTGNYLAYILLALLGVIVLLRLYVKTPRGRLNKDWLISRVPFLGTTVRSTVTMRFARTANILLRSGIPLLQGLDYIKQNLDHALAERAVEYAREGLQRGEPLADNLARGEYFDPLAVHMFSIGEETGELEQILDEMTGYYEKESDAGFTKLLSMVEPAMLIIIGAIVSVVIISVMLPMLDMVTNLETPY